MVRRSTWFAILVFAGLIGLTVYMRQAKNRAVETESTPTPESQPLFEAALAQPVSIQISPKDSAQGSFAMIQEGGDWIIKEPVEAKADLAQAEAAATQIGALQKLATVDVSPEDVGLDHPAYRFTIGFAGSAGIGGVNEQHLQIGDLTPTGTGYYARRDDGEIFIVSSDGIQGLLNLLASPPFAETPTPSPAPATETPVPTAGVPTETPGTPSP